MRRRDIARHRAPVAPRSVPARRLPTILTLMVVLALLAAALPGKLLVQAQADNSSAPTAELLDPLADTTGAAPATNPDSAGTDATDPDPAIPAEGNGDAPSATDVPQAGTDTAPTEAAPAATISAPFTPTVPVGYAPTANTPATTVASTSVQPATVTTTPTRSAASAGAVSNTTLSAQAADGPEVCQLVATVKSPPTNGAVAEASFTVSDAEGHSAVYPVDANGILSLSQSRLDVAPNGQVAVPHPDGGQLTVTQIGTRDGLSLGDPPYSFTFTYRSAYSKACRVDVTIPNPVAAAPTATTAPPAATATSTPTATATDEPPTETATIPPTATATMVPPTATATAVPPTATSTREPTATDVPTATATATATSAPTTTATAVPATATATATDTPAPTVTATAPPTSTATLAPTATAIPTTATATAPATAEPTIPSGFGQVEVWVVAAAAPGEAPMRLPGSRLSIENEYGRVMAQFATGADGTARSPLLPLGHYTVIMDAPPTGYQLAHVAGIRFDIVDPRLQRLVFTVSPDPDHPTATLVPPTATPLHSRATSTVAAPPSVTATSPTTAPPLRPTSTPRTSRPTSTPTGSRTVPATATMAATTTPGSQQPTSTPRAGRPTSTPTRARATPTAPIRTATPRATSPTTSGLHLPRPGSAPTQHPAATATARAATQPTATPVRPQRPTGNRTATPTIRPTATVLAGNPVRPPRGGQATATPTRQTSFPDAKVIVVVKICNDARSPGYARFGAPDDIGSASLEDPNERSCRAARAGEVSMTLTSAYPTELPKITLTGTTSADGTVTFTLDSPRIPRIATLHLNGPVVAQDVQMKLFAGRVLQIPLAIYPVPRTGFRAGAGDAPASGGAPPSRDLGAMWARSTTWH